MGNSSDSGHKSNVMNFEQLVSACHSFEDVYKPSRECLSLMALLAIKQSAFDSFTVLNAAIAENRNAIVARKMAFANFDNLITRVYNALRASGSSSEMDEMVHTIIRKLKGERVSPKKTEEEKKAAAASGKEIVEISSSQRSFDSRIENMDKLLKLLGTIPEYSPNEEDLTLASLIAYYDNLNNLNKAVIASEAPLTKARIARNKILYAENVGLVDIAFDVKLYVKSAFGSQSAEYKQISSIKFIRMN